MAYKNRIIYILLLLIVGSSSYRLSATSHSDSIRHHVPKAPPSVYLKFFKQFTKTIILQINTLSNFNFATQSYVKIFLHKKSFFLVKNLLL